MRTTSFPIVASMPSSSSNSRRRHHAAVRLPRSCRPEIPICSGIAWWRVRWHARIRPSFTIRAATTRFMDIQYSWAYVRRLTRLHPSVSRRFPTTAAQYSTSSRSSLSNAAREWLSISSSPATLPRMKMGTTISDFVSIEQDKITGVLRDIVHNDGVHPTRRPRRISHR